MSEKATNIIHRFEQHFPLCLAEKGDPNGLQIGTLNKEINKIMITLDVRPEVVKEAIEKEVDLIIAKHPPIFVPVHSLLEDDPQQKMYIDLVSHNIAVYAAHTNMDIVEDGLNDWFCEALDIKNTTYLSPIHTLPYALLTVMVPKGYEAQVKEALVEAGAGDYGQYDQCIFSVSGKGQFRPKEGSQAFVGQVGELTHTEETCLTMVVPPLKQKMVEQALLKSHPYEMPAYYFQELSSLTKTYGIGRVGDLKEPMTVKALAEKLKAVFAIDHVRFIGHDENKQIRRVAICGGSGQNFYKDALKQKADVYITGDVYYHTGHDMMETPLTVLDPGHYIEHYCKDKIVALMNQWKQELNWEVEIISSEVSTNPFKAL